MIELDRAPGSVSVAVEVTFPAGLPGFPHAHVFQLAPCGTGRSPFLRLDGLDDPSARFVVVSPWSWYPEYVFTLDDDEARRLGLRNARDALVFCVVTLGEERRDATLNMVGPIVINRRTLEAAQIAVPAIGYGLRAPLAVAS